MASLYTIDDDARIRDAIRQLFADSSRHRLVGEATTVAEARAGIPALEPDVILVDLDLPDGRGTEVLDARGREGRAPLALVLTVFDDDEHIFDALRKGAVGYILKDELIAKLAAAIDDLVAGGSPMSPTVARRVLGSFLPPAREDQSLTAREREVVELLSHGSTYGEIARMLGISTNTVRTHVRSSYEKLHVSSKTEASLEALRRGIITRR